MSLLQRFVQPTVRRVATMSARSSASASSSSSSVASALPKRQMSSLGLQIENVVKRGEQSEYVHARDQLIGLAGCGLFIGYAVKVLLGEPAHEEAHPYYGAPYSFVKRGADIGAGWWPGRHCQFFEFNCFAATYKEADELLAEQKQQKH